MVLVHRFGKQIFFLYETRRYMFPAQQARYFVFRVIKEQSKLNLWGGRGDVGCACGCFR